MRKLLLGLALSLVFGTSSAMEQDFSKVQITVTKVAGNVYMLQGEGGNIGVSVGEDGIVIVDNQFAPLTDKIKAALKGISDKPIRFVINTHHHFEHTGSNAVLQDSATIVIAHDNARKRLETGSTIGNGTTMMEMKPTAKAGLPVITFSEDATLHMNGEEIRALHYPRGHTDGDAVVFFPKSNVVHMGDDFVTYGFPFVDLAGGGSVEGLIEAIADVITKVPDDVKVIPGHGAISTKEDLQKYLIMLRGTYSVIAKAAKKGQTLDQMKQQRLLDYWKNYSGPFVTLDGYMEALYNELNVKKIVK